MKTSLMLSLTIIYVIGGISASLIYHQTLTHKVIKLKSWFEKIMVLIALPVGTPVQWVGTHRQHHLYTDVEGDPHSPKIFGFWYAHCGWYISSKSTFLCFFYAFGGIFRMFFDAYWRPRNRLEYNHLAVDISNIKFYETISRPAIYSLIVFVYATFLCVVFYSLGGLLGFFLLWLVLTLVYNFGDAINSVGHLFGEKLNGKTNSKNNALLSKFTFGEGLHANHHNNPKLQINATSKLNLLNIVLKIWKALGVAKLSS